MDCGERTGGRGGGGQNTRERDSACARETRRAEEKTTPGETEVGERWRVTRGTGSSDPPTLLDSREMGMEAPQAWPQSLEQLSVHAPTSQALLCNVPLTP